MEYPLAKDGVFATVQGEGELLGSPMVFVRFAGCPVGCVGCDTDYTFAERATEFEIVSRVIGARTPGTRWVWLTGGEPAVHDLQPIINLIHRQGMKVAVATSGVRRISWGSVLGYCDFLSVSPHSLGSTWLQRSGTQLNIVPGLNGLSLDDVEAADRRNDFGDFLHKWITPMWTPKDGPANLGEVMAFANRRPRWRVGIQAHKVWGIA